MKYFIIGSIFFLSTLPLCAQTQGVTTRIDSLVQRVDSLEHELSYFKLTYELRSLNSEISMFSNDVHTNAIAIQLNLYNRIFDPQLASTYKRYYESCENKMKTYAESIEVNKTLFALKVSTYPYTESELSTLLASYNLINTTFESLQSSMELLKLTIEEYRKHA